MTYRSGLVRFMFANSFYLGICSLFLLIGLNIEKGDANIFAGKNLYLYVFISFGIILIVSRFFIVFYIRRFGIVAYNTSRYRAIYTLLS